MNDDELLAKAQNLADEALSLWEETEKQARRTDANVARAKKTYEQAIALVKTLEAM